MFMENVGEKDEKLKLHWPTEDIFHFRTFTVHRF